MPPWVIKMQGDGGKEVGVASVPEGRGSEGRVLVPEPPPGLASLRALPQGFAHLQTLRGDCVIVCLWLHV